MFEQTNFFISDKKKLLNPQQYGFRPNCSTSIALKDICNELLHNLEKNKISCTVFLDLAKAFNTIDHTILIKKLKQNEIRGTPLKLLKNYLHNRKQQTLYQGTLSDYKTITCDVPQRSTLGPLLFLNCINDIPLHKNFKVRLLADDTNLTLAEKSVSILQNLVNLEMCEIDHWIHANKLSINSTKSQYMLVTNKKFDLDHFKVSSNNSEIKRNGCIKYLGVLTDDKLCWKNHIDYIYQTWLLFT